MNTSITRKLPIGIQTFEKIRQGEFLYVDKTALVWNIAMKSVPCFLSRRVALGRVYYSQLSNPISMDARIYLKGWLSSNWNMTGQFIPYCILI